MLGSAGEEKNDNQSRARDMDQPSGIFATVRADIRSNSRVIVPRSLCTAIGGMLMAATAAPVAGATVASGLSEVVRRVDRPPIVLVRDICRVYNQGRKKITEYCNPPYVCDYANGKCKPGPELQHQLDEEQRRKDEAKRAELQRLDQMRRDLEARSLRRTTRTTQPYHTTLPSRTTHSSTGGSAASSGMSAGCNEGRSGCPEPRPRQQQNTGGKHSPGGKIRQPDYTTIGVLVAQGAFGDFLDAHGFGYGVKNCDPVLEQCTARGQAEEVSTDTVDGNITATTGTQVTRPRRSEAQTSKTPGEKTPDQLEEAAERFFRKPKPRECPPDLAVVELRKWQNEKCSEKAKNENGGINIKVLTECTGDQNRANANLAEDNKKIRKYNEMVRECRRGK